MKKIFSFVMIAAMAFALVSCGGEKKDVKDPVVSDVIAIYQKGTAEVKTCIDNKEKVRAIYEEMFGEMTKLAAANLTKLTENDYSYCMHVQTLPEVVEAQQAWEAEFHKSDSSVWGWASPVVLGNALVKAEENANAGN